MMPADLAARMHDPHARLLILDLRQPSAFHAGHVAHAVSLPIPSTLLKRQAFTLDKLQDMLSPRSAAVVAAWRERTDVVIVDQDSAAAQAGSVVAGMASKFRAADPEWDGKIWFLKGGMSACRGVKEVELEYGSDDVEESQGTEDGEVEKEKDSVEGGSVGKAKMFGGLSRAAFQQGPCAVPQRERLLTLL
jgi:rhodanese-related sulfurtransferase